MKEGERLKLTDGKGNLITAKIMVADKKHSVVSIEERNYQPPVQKRISVAISLLKNMGRFEWFVEKATEIGVSEIIPLICERTERQHFRLERVEHILVSAMLQSEQAWMPVLTAPQLYEEVISSSNYPQKLIAHCENELVRQHIGDAIEADELQILIGPEGDFTSHEIEHALANNYRPVSLGRTRLRSETAGVVAATFLLNR